MRTVVRNSFGRNTVLAEKVPMGVAVNPGSGCRWCGQVRGQLGATWLYRFHVDDDGGRSGAIADGKLFCSRGCCESYTGQPMDETEVA